MGSEMCIRDRYIAMRNPNAKIIPICAKTGEGIAEWTDWLREQVKAWQA